MKTGKKKTRSLEMTNEEMLRKPGKKVTSKKDRKISIYNPHDDEDDEMEIDDLFDFDPDQMEDDNDENQEY